MVSSRFWYFFIHNHDDRNMLSQAIQVLDHDLAAHMGVSEIFYGFLPYDGSHYGIEGYISFFVPMNYNDVTQVLPNFELNIFDYLNHKLILEEFLGRNSIFTKSGNAWNEGDPLHALDVDWHYNINIDFEVEENPDDDEVTCAQ